MKNSAFWIFVAITAFIGLVGLAIGIVKRHFAEEKQNSEIARRRIENQLAAFQRTELSVSENTSRANIITIVDNVSDRDVEERYEKIA